MIDLLRFFFFVNRAPLHLLANIHGVNTIDMKAQGINISDLKAKGANQKTNKQTKHLFGK